MAAVLVLQGPNLNLLGSREPTTYGHETLNDIHLALQQQASAAGHQLSYFQSNSEAQLIERVHQSKDDGTAFIIFNPAAFTHTSIALRDALLAVTLPFIEVHLSNVYRRETFRHHSYFSDIADGVIIGLGSSGYQLALEAIITRLNTQAG